VLLFDLHRASRVQQSLFDKREDARRLTLMRTLDRLNQRYGRDTLTFAMAGRRQPWRMQRDRPSPCYTIASYKLLRV
jgi:DNA polymerase V